MEITLKLTADPKLETLLDKLCNALDLGNGLPFTAAQVTPVNPTTAGTTALPAHPVTASSAPTATPVSTTTPAAPVNPTPAGMTTASTTTAAQVVSAVQPATTVPLQSAPVTVTAPTAPSAPVTTTTTPGVPVAQQPTTAPIAAPAVYTIEQLQGAVGPLLMGGKGPLLQGLLKKYGVSRLPDLTEDKRGAFAADLRGMGAQI